MSIYIHYSSSVAGKMSSAGARPCKFRSVKHVRGDIFKMKKRSKTNETLAKSAFIRTFLEYGDILKVKDTK